MLPVPDIFSVGSTIKGLRTGLKVPAAGFGLKTKELAFGLSFAAACDPEAWDAADGVGDAAKGIFCDADGGTGRASGFRFVGLNGGISGIFINIFLAPTSFAGSILGVSIADAILSSALRVLVDS